MKPPPAIIALGAVTMAGAIKQITIERGMDPRDFDAVCIRRRRSVACRNTRARTQYPRSHHSRPEPGNFSAIGMLVSDARVDETHPFLRDFTQDAVTEMITTFVELEKRLRDTLSAEIGSVEIGLQRAAEMRCRAARSKAFAPRWYGDRPCGNPQIFNTTYLRRLDTSTRTRRSSSLASI